MDRYIRKTTVFGILAAVAAVAAPIGAASAWAELYYYKDADGVFHFTERKVSGAEPFRREVRRSQAKRPARAARLRPARTVLPSRPSRPSRPALRRADAVARYDRLIEATARRYGVEPELVKAVIRAESNFNRLAVSHKGARGLMQLMPRTARSYGVRNPHDPEQNIRGGVRHLRGLLDRFRSVRLAVAAYNAGATAVRRHRGVPPYRETRRYVEKVLRFRAEYQRRPGVVFAAASVDAG